MSDFKELLQFLWEDIKAPDVSYMERVVFFVVPISILLGMVGLIIYAG